MKRVCIYHSGDLDGMCSAAIVAIKFPDVELVGWSYGQPIPDIIKNVDELIIVDLSLPVEVMTRSNGYSDIRSIVWIDHHKTAIESLPSDIPGLREISSNKSGRAACELVWKYYFPLIDIPRSVWLLGRWDTWQWVELPQDDHNEVEAFQYGMRSEDTNPKSQIWKSLFVDSDFVRFVVECGNTILIYRNQQNERIANSAFETYLDGYRVLALNAGGGSTVFDSIWNNHPECVAMCTFVFTGQRWNVSLYSDRGFDCSILAKSHGGGGHVGAAGFSCDVLPFVLGKRNEK